MKPIPISSCQHCDPETWQVVKEAKGVYVCKRKKCKKLITEVLKRKEKTNE